MKYELAREPFQAFAPFSIAALIPVSLVTSPSELNTATSGRNSPLPNAFSVFWFVSYAE